MKVFIDTNVLLDYILQRDEGQSKIIMEWGYNKSIELCASYLSYADSAYILGKYLSRDEIRLIFNRIRGFCKLLPMDARQFDFATCIGGIDLEDTFQSVCADFNHCDVIVTRNTAHFEGCPLTVLTPAEFLRKVKE